MTYLISIFSDRIQAEEAYTAIEKAGIPTKQVFIVGKGYKNAEDFGFIDPDTKAKRNATRMAFWLIPFGFFGGFTFDAITNLDTFAWAGTPGNHIVGGLLGAIGGAMGSFFVGGNFVLTRENEDESLLIIDYLKNGKYLIIVEGSNNLKKEAYSILKNFDGQILSQS